MANELSELGDGMFGVHAAFGERRQGPVEAFDIIGQLLDTPRERTDTPCQRTDHGLKPGQALVVLGLIVQEEFDGFFDVHLFHDTIIKDKERQIRVRGALSTLDEHFR